jgi:hypothetical protein
MFLPPRCVGTDRLPEGKVNWVLIYASVSLIPKHHSISSTSVKHCAFRHHYVTGKTIHHIKGNLI